MRRFLLFSSFFSLLFFCLACKKEEVPPLSPEEIFEQTLQLPETPFNYANVVLPEYLNDFPNQREDNMPESNPITDWGATLGRVLFYEKGLSLNETIACASCHLQEKNFSDPARFSVGFAGEETSRQSMSLTNARYYNPGTFFWDERAESLEEQVVMPIQDHIEMGLTLEEMIERLEERTYYSILFEKAFGDAQITTDRVARALAQFIRSIVSFNSPFDRAVVNAGITESFSIGETPFEDFTELENIGLDFFFNRNRGCASCHRFGFMVTDVPANNGLDSTYTDLGKGGITGNEYDMGKFKVPSLRNVAVSGPYMHDGRFDTLEEVIEHYSSGVQFNPNLDFRLRTIASGSGAARPLNLSETQKEGILAFLQTLTDDEFLEDEKFSNPFK